MESSQRQSTLWRRTEDETIDSQFKDFSFQILEQNPAHHTHLGPRGVIKYWARTRCSLIFCVQYALVCCRKEWKTSCISIC